MLAVKCLAKTFRVRANVNAYENGPICVISSLGKVCKRIHCTMFNVNINFGQ